MLHSHGIYILAGDAQCDQLMALIHSIGVNVSDQLPICIIPASDEVGQIQRAIAHVPQLSLFADRACLARWEQFAREVWQSLPLVNQLSQRYARHYDEPERFRKFCAFEGPFEKFVVFDVASLALKPLEDCWAKLEDYDVVVDDGDYTKPASLSAFDWTMVNAAKLNAAKLNAAKLNPAAQPEPLAGIALRPRLHGAQFFASKRGLFGPERLAQLRHQLIDQGEVRWINALSWWSDDALFCYMTLRGSDRPAPLFNYSLTPGLGQPRGQYWAMGDDPGRVAERRFCGAAVAAQLGLEPMHRRLEEGHNSTSREVAPRGAGKRVQRPFDDLVLHDRFLPRRVRRLPRRLRLAQGSAVRAQVGAGAIALPRLRRWQTVNSAIAP